jgi:hypothetical protein
VLATVRRQLDIGLRRAQRRFGALDHPDSRVVRAIDILDVGRLCVLHSAEKHELGA